MNKVSKSIFNNGDIVIPMAKALPLTRNMRDKLGLTDKQMLAVCSLAQKLCG